METQEQHTKRVASVMRSLTNITPAPSAVERIEVIRTRAKAYADAILGLSDQSREQSCALTKLEESVMWAVKGIVLELPPVPQDRPAQS